MLGSIASLAGPSMLSIVYDGSLASSSWNQQEIVLFVVQAAAPEVRLEKLAVSICASRDDP